MSQNNYEYIKKEISTVLQDIVDKNILNNILDDLLIVMNEYDCYDIINNSKTNVRNSSTLIDELNRLNSEFIKDRIMNAQNINLYSQSTEDYGMQMFIEDSLHPEYFYNDPKHSSIHDTYFNDKSDSDYEFDSDSDSNTNTNTNTTKKNNSKRIFRYQDKYNSNRSYIPIWQINKRGYTDYTNQDELRNSDISQIRSVPDALIKDRLSSLATNSVPKWIDK